MQHISTSSQETREIGFNLASKLEAGQILELHGDLGTGKTTLMKGIGKFFDIKEEITSPSFSIMNIYQTNQNKVNQIVHIDTYRLENEQELIEIGFEDYLEDQSVVCIIEWPEKIQNLIKNKKTTKVVLKHDPDNPDSRIIEIE